MSEAAVIPHGLHVGLRPSMKDSLGTFWSSLFKDQDFIDALLAARSLSATQLQIDAGEALVLRDHRNTPVWHREHWHPLFIRKKQQNRGRGLSIGMDSAKIGPQETDAVYLRGEKFVIGGNADYSKVNTYPFVSMNGCRLMRVLTCICDSISAPGHILVQGRDFELVGDVLVVRKEQDPFAAGGYHTVEDGNDQVAVLWVCDGEYDTNNVADFLSYPMGFDVGSSEESKRLLSAYWDAVVHGVTPMHLNTMLGALYGVPTAESDGEVEAVEQDGDYTIITTPDRVYRVASSHVRGIRVGDTLHAGDFLTDELSVYHSFSEDEFSGLVSALGITKITLPEGSVAGVDVPVEIGSVAGGSALNEPEKWFKINGSDTVDSPFWTAVLARTTPEEREAVFRGMAVNGRVDPVRKVGYAALANTVIVKTSRPLVDVAYAVTLMDALRRLMPGYASLLTVREVTGD